MTTTSGVRHITLGNGSDTVTAISWLINGGHGHELYFNREFRRGHDHKLSPAHDNIVLAQAMFANFGAVQSDMTQVGADTVMRMIRQTWLR